MQQKMEVEVTKANNGRLRISDMVDTGRQRWRDELQTEEEE